VQKNETVVQETISDFIIPPSLDELEKLHAEYETEAQIQMRMKVRWRKSE
jgi:guanylate kinase